MICKRCGSQIEDNSTFCPTCGQVQQPVNNPAYTPAPEFPMKWYKFVVYFQLFVSALMSAFNAVQYFTGLHYGADAAEAVYSTFGTPLKVLDVFMGILSIAAVVLSIMARQKLRHFKKKAPNWYLLVLGLNLAISLLYVVFASIITGLMLFDASVIGTVTSSILMIVLSNIYFNKRSVLFIND